MQQVFGPTSNCTGEVRPSPHPPVEKAYPKTSYNLSLHDRPFLRYREGYWNTIEEDFHWHIEILPQMFRVTGFEWASGFFYNPAPPELAARSLSMGGQI
jgi:galactose-1-phosphate uridylyltransferase